MIGKTVRDRYDIVAKIGEGGMGVVYKALDKTLQRLVAIKMLHPAHSNQMLKTRFQVEALATASLNHRSIVTLYDFFEEEENQFLVMELLEGRTCKELLEEKGAIPAPALIKIFESATEGLAYAHHHGIIHRDIKPNNIMITASGEVKIMDFGIARTQDSPQLTQAGFTVGSALYMSPEQIKNEKVDHRSDIYSLGITLFEMATGKAPFHDPNASEYNILIGHLSSELPSPRSVNPDIPVTIEEVIFKATRKDPAERFQTMKEFGAALTSDSGATKVKPILKDVAPTGVNRLAAGREFRPANPPWRSAFFGLNPGTIFLAVVLAVGLATIGVVLVLRHAEQPETKPLERSNKVHVQKNAVTSRAIEPATMKPQKPQPEAVIGYFKTMCLKDGKRLFEVKDADTMTPQDRYYLEFSADEKLYLYVAQVDTTDSIIPIFPNTKFSSIKNPVTAHSEYRFPQRGYFFLDKNIGKEHIYVIASRTPNPDIDTIYKKLITANNTENKQLANEFMDKVRRQDPANVRSLWFWHK